MGMARKGIRRRAGRISAGLLALVLALTIVWWGVGRATAPTRKVSVHEISPMSLFYDSLKVDGPGSGSLRGDSLAVEPSGASGAPPLRILVWNLAHGRGDIREGWQNNWRGGTPEARVARLARMISVLREAHADLVILNEVDFRARWSQELNQAETLAMGAGYPFRAEQRNYDLHLPFLTLEFGNAILSRYPILSADLVPLPPHSRIEAFLLGAKTAMVVRIATGDGTMAVVPVHLEVRSPETRMAALPSFRGLAARSPEPVILAGDFNSAPSGWPRAGKGWADIRSDSGAEARGTILDSLLVEGWTSPRARREPGPGEFTFPTVAPKDARDWVLAESPLEILEVAVLRDPATLSDHAPLLARVVVRKKPEP